uniref:PDZ domain-containing protein GIPC3 n=1 Tax=Schistosoma japonicum TaxID=6182 RepID=C1L6G1_SCHJA|nr:PDZ domain-containing protein GIPC3 [Schistosoma japonicum]
MSSGIKHSNGRDPNPRNILNHEIREYEPLPDYQFFCQLAHGSPTGIIHGFRTVRQLHTKISECFDINPSQIMFCTRNTHKLDMDKLLSYEIGLNDFLFAHIKGQPKEIKIRKTSESFGLTLTDNGCGVVIIKRIKPGGFMDNVSKACGGLIQPGDQIEKINNISFTGKRHYHVASYLQSIPITDVFCLRLISPERCPMYMLNSRSKSKEFNIGSGKKTIRLKQNGRMEEGEIIDVEVEGTQRINEILDNFLGFEDNELAFYIYKLAKSSTYSKDLEEHINKNKLFEFTLPKHIISLLWNAANLQQYTMNVLHSNSKYCYPISNLQRNL